jgi:hypothetical protein
MKTGETREIDRNSAVERRLLGVRVTAVLQFVLAPVRAACGLILIELLETLPEFLRTGKLR